MRVLRYLLALTSIFLMTGTLFGQSDVTVPDITGLNVPQAAATLNEAGLALGIETAIDLASGGGQAAGTVFSQAVAAGSTVAAGSSVDIEVLRSDNVRLVYDDNDLTLVNTTNNVADVTGLRFAATEGTSPASFAASRWGSNVREKWCLQIWSVPVRDSKPVSGCEDVQWLTTNTTGEHFWTASNGVEAFAVIEDGITRETCTGAPLSSQDSPLNCSFYLAGAGSAGDLTSYFYLVYTTGSIALVNQTQDRWMPADRTTIYNFNPNIDVEGASLILGDPALFQNPQIVADITQLAPGQCLVLTADDASPQLSEPCNIIAQRSLSSTVAFWLADFEIESATDGARHTCPAANPERPTICIVPQ